MIAAISAPMPRCEASISYETDTILGKFRLPKIAVFCSYNTAGVINGDVNGDGNTDIQDVTLILMYIVKRIREFPAAAA